MLIEAEELITEELKTELLLLLLVTGADKLVSEFAALELIMETVVVLPTGSLDELDALWEEEFVASSVKLDIVDTEIVTKGIGVLVSDNILVSVPSFDCEELLETVSVEMLGEISVDGLDEL